MFVSILQPDNCSIKSVVFCMNYSQINRNSLMSNLYSDRPSYFNQQPDTWRSNLNEQHHLNPSKSKVNVRQSLNKTTEHTPVNSTIANIRNSCVIPNTCAMPNPLTATNNKIDMQIFKTDAKDSKQPAVQKYLRDKYSQVMPSPNFNEQRRKSQSAHQKTISKDDFIFKLQENIAKEEKPLWNDQVKAQIAALTKRVTASEQEIKLLKEKDNKIMTLQGEMTQYRNQVFEYFKFSSNHFSQMEIKLQDNQKTINQIRDRMASNGEKEELRLKKSQVFQTKLNQLYEGFKNKEDYNSKNITAHTAAIQANIRKWANQEMQLIRTTLDKSKNQIIDIGSKVKKVELQLQEKHQQIEEFKRSSKKSGNSLIVENRETLIVRDTQLFRDKTKQLLNYDQTPRRDHNDQTPRRDHQSGRRQTFDLIIKRDSEQKKQLIIKQKLYYIDTMGYLLDENRYYLLNANNEQILLPQHLIASLRENNILARTK